jgi:hypothetical protein
MFSLLFYLSKLLRLYTRCVDLTQSRQMYDIVLTVLYCLGVQRSNGKNDDVHELLDIVFRLKPVVCLHEPKF